MKQALPFVVFALFASIIWFRQRRGAMSPGVRFRDLPRSVQGPLLPAWILGLVGTIGSEANEGLLVALIPAGALLVVAGVALRDLSADAFRTNPRIVGLGAIVIGIGWGAIGVVELVTLLR